MGKQEKPLTFKQEKFCKYYVDTEGNASEAYRMSYDASKMKPETIWSAASRLLANSKVSARISEIKQQRAKETEVERKTVEKVLMDIVLADPDDLHYVDPVTGKTKMRSPSQLPKRARNALKTVCPNVHQTPCRLSAFAPAHYFEHRHRHPIARQIPILQSVFSFSVYLLCLKVLFIAVR